MRTLGFDRLVRGNVKVRESDCDYSKVEGLVLLMASGAECIADIATLKVMIPDCVDWWAIFEGADAFRTFLYEFQPHSIGTEAAARKRLATFYLAIAGT
jgi:hypothetical protein